MAESATAAMFRRVAELRQQGVDLVSMSVGEPDAQPPEYVREAMKRAIDQGASRYTEVAGLRSLREAILADSLRRRGVEHGLDEVVVSCGAKHTLFNLFLAVLDEGDEVVIPSPYWVSYPEQVQFAGGTPVIAETTEEDGFLLRPEALKAALTPRTEAFVLNSPSNPTGAMYSSEALTRLAASLDALSDRLAARPCLHERGRASVEEHAEHLELAVAPGPVGNGELGGRIGRVPPLVLGRALVVGGP